MSPGSRCGPRARCGRCCSRRCSRTIAASRAGRRCWSPPTTAPPATWPPTCAPTWPRAGSATTPRGGPATRPTSRRRRTWSACGSTPSTRSGREPEPVVVASAIALAEAVPDASLRPAGFAIERGRGDRPRRRRRRPRRRPATSASTRSPSAASSRSAAASSTSSRPPRSGRCGSSCSATRSSRCAGSRPSPSARSATPSGSSWPRPPSSTPSTASWPSWRRWRRGGRRGPGPQLDVLPLEHFRRPARPGPDDAAVVLAAADEIEPALRDHWEDATTAMHADDARHLYVDVADPLARARRARDHRAPATTTPTPSAPRGPSRRRAACARPRPSSRSWSAPATAPSSPSTAAARPSAPATTSTASTRRCSTAAGSRPSRGSRFAEARLREGFVAPELRLAVYPFRRLVHRRRAPRAAAGRAGRGRLAFSELRVGDYVVHEDHGVARFAGFETREVGGVTRDYLYLEYKGEDRVYVPTDQLAKLSPLRRRRRRAGRSRRWAASAGRT